MPRRQNQAGRLAVFKGREAKLNRAIFQALALKGPQTIYDVHKQIRTCRGLRYTRYASVNKRIKALEESGYVKKAGLRKTKAGFEVTIYEIRVKAYLAVALSSVNLEDFLQQTSDDTALAILGIVCAKLDTENRSRKHAHYEEG